MPAGVEAMDDREGRLASLIYQAAQQGSSNVWNMAVAQAILADPQAHVGALAEAGILKPVIHTNDLTVSLPRKYEVVLPEPPRCKAWVEIGHGQQTCGREENHEGPHSSRDPVIGRLVSQDVFWNTGP